MLEMEAMDLLRKSGAYQQGHFRLSSGLHSGAYMQTALLLQDPRIAARVASVLTAKIGNLTPDTVIGPAMGGVILAYELARDLNARALFSERDDDGKMRLRRGFSVSPANSILIAEDVLTTGKSIREVITLLKEDGIRPVGIVCLVDRSGGRVDFDGIQVESLIKLNIPVFEEDKCPLCQEGMPIVKPGSRK